MEGDDSRDRSGGVENEEATQVRSGRAGQETHVPIGGQGHDGATASTEPSFEPRHHPASLAEPAAPPTQGGIALLPAQLEEQRVGHQEATEGHHDERPERNLGRGEEQLPVSGVEQQLDQGVVVDQPGGDDVGHHADGRHHGDGDDERGQGHPPPGPGMGT